MVEGRVSRPHPANDRATVLDRLAEWLATQELDHPLRVGLDGVCGAGKTTFGNALAERIAAQGRIVVRLDSDRFHHVRAVRYRQGRDSGRGYYDDAYDFEGLRDLTLRPLGPGGSRRFAEGIHDRRSDDVRVDWGMAPREAVVIFDATFIQRGGLRDAWDVVVYLDVSRDVALGRGIARDSTALGGEEPAREAYLQRYMAACDLYLAEEDPVSRATVVVDNNDPDHPVLRRAPWSS
jgi:uridine kinase